MTRIPAAEREKMLAVRLCGPRVIARLEAIGVTQLHDLAERDPYQLVHEINMAAGRPIWHPPPQPNENRTRNPTSVARGDRGNRAATAAPACPECLRRPRSQPRP